jgi:hypothetical protein
MADKLETATAFLDILAKLGNGEHYGNSHGNGIARHALNLLNKS